MKKIYIDYYLEEDIVIWKNYENIIHSIILKIRRYYKCKKTIFILLTNKKSMISLNRRYRKIEKDTNVISLEMNDDLCAGELILSFEKIFNEYEQKEILNESFEFIYSLIYESFYNYLVFIITHGFLHLLGYDHQNLQEEQIMNKEQQKLMEYILKAKR